MLNHKPRITKLCHEDTLRAPALFLAQTSSFSSESQSQYSIYCSFAILKNNSTSALKCVALVAKKTVDWLWTNVYNPAFGCVQNVYKSLFVHTSKTSIVSCAQFILAKITGLLNKFLIDLTSLSSELCPKSTVPIITIYLYKGDYI